MTTTRKTQRKTPNKKTVPKPSETQPETQSEDQKEETVSEPELAMESQETLERQYSDKPSLLYAVCAPNGQLVVCFDDNQILTQDQTAAHTIAASLGDMHSVHGYRLVRIQ